MEGNLCYTIFAAGSESSVEVGCSHTWNGKSWGCQPSWIRRFFCSLRELQTLGTLKANFSSETGRTTSFFYLTESSAKRRSFERTAKQVYCDLTYIFSIPPLFGDAAYLIEDGKRVWKTETPFFRRNGFYSNKPPKTKKSVPQTRIRSVRHGSIFLSWKSPWRKNLIFSENPCKSRQYVLSYR